MISTTQQQIVRQLSSVLDLSPNIRVGQLLAHLGFLAEDMFDRSLAEIEDEQLLQVLRRHESELLQRQSHVA